LIKLNIILYELYEKEYLETNGMWSEHLILFSAISQSKFKIKTILEIGTFNGETATILSLLFPNSKIETYDLPVAEMVQDQIYNYATNNQQLISERELNLKNLSNVKFIEKNSLELLNVEKKYDLIWIDGAHGYPIASIDIANAVRMLSNTGIAICDDVYLKSKKIDKFYRSTASIETLQELNKSGLIKFKLVSKRKGFFFNNPNKYQKFLAIFWKKDYLPQI
jgi:predicted O-methyltransferase YrrM